MQPLSGAPDALPRPGLPWGVIGTVLVIAALGAAFVMLPVQAWVEAFAAWVGGLGTWGPVLYVLAYAAATVVLVPGGLLSVGAGFVFGMWGVPVVLVGATTGAALAFLVSRHLLRDRVRRMIARRPALLAVDRAVGDEGWRIVGLLRLSPLVPFALQNYFFGVTPVGFWPYVAATAAGIMPGAGLYVYLGAIGRTAGGGAGPARWVLLAAGLAATAAAAALVGRRARAALRAKGVGA